MGVKDFKKGDRVKYFPQHMQSEPDGPDAERGVVSSTNTLYVFVKYDRPGMIMLTGDEDVTAQATNPWNLVKEE